MKTIIRIEHLDGIGLFQDYHKSTNFRPHSVFDICEDLGERHQNGNFPVPSRDNLDINKEDKEWFCAYKSIDQLQQWVKKDEFQILFENNYKVLLLDVTEYQEGEYQIVFTKESIIQTKDISNLFR